ncbi:MAG TPA: peptidylprolyl isomerase [Steroidobacteraceae bacterium]|nr:peptidylprolyl isomerase [Steroidobacteraceae bacterium]
MKYLLATILLVSSGSLLAQETAPATPAPTASRVRVDTSMGSFTIRLETQRAPLTVDNFLKYVRAGHYEGTVFHRVIRNFVAQGGGYTTAFEAKPTQGALANESGNGLLNRRGTVGMARSEAPHSGNCQFFINLADNPDLNPIPTRWGYAVFGEIVEGMDVVDRIAHVPTGEWGPFKEDAPLKPIVIEKITVVE